MRTVTVRILASDPGTREGAIALLSAHPNISVLRARAVAVPDVLFVNPTLVSESVVRSLELVPTRGRGMPAADRRGHGADRTAATGPRPQHRPGLPARPAQERLRPDRARDPGRPRPLRDRGVSPAPGAHGNAAGADAPTGPGADGRNRLLRATPEAACGHRVRPGMTGTRETWWRQAVRRRAWHWRRPGFVSHRPAIGIELPG